MEEQEIRDWCVTDEDRILGNVHNRPGHADGETIITSSVLQVRRMGAAKLPLAVTETGSTYWLGTPSRRFGLEKAEAFIARLASGIAPVHPVPDAGDRETVLPGFGPGEAARRAGTHTHTHTGPRLAVTCELCGAGAIATLSDDVSSVNAAGGISVDDRCPACGGGLSARAGRYRLNDATGMLVRIGDFQAAPHPPLN